MPFRMLLAVVVLVSWPLVAAADIYQWFYPLVEDGGALSTQKVKSYREVTATRAPAANATGSGAIKTAAKAGKAQAEPFSGTVVLYVTSWCPHCKDAKRYLDSRGIPYVAYDIERDSAARQRHQQLGGGGVPLIVIGSKKLSGFSPQAVEYYLKNSR